jgi:NADPH:quinone reductase-like Zn-dependent oxidoreductase
VSIEDLKSGQLVFGRLDSPRRFGTLGGYIIPPRAGTVPLPDGVEVDDAACIGTAGLAAYQSIVPYVKKGDGVFINGGSGGTGVFGIQIAKAKDCYVVTACSTANVELCKRLGADEVIDYKKSGVVEILKKSGRKFDLVVDNEDAPKAFERLKTKRSKGKVVIKVSMDEKAEM